MPHKRFSSEAKGQFAAAAVIVLIIIFMKLPGLGDEYRMYDKWGMRSDELSCELAYQDLNYEVRLFSMFEDSLGPINSLEIKKGSFNFSQKWRKYIGKELPEEVTVSSGVASKRIWLHRTADGALKLSADSNDNYGLDVTNRDLFNALQLHRYGPYITLSSGTAELAKFRTEGLDTALAAFRLCDFFINR